MFGGVPTTGWYDGIYRQDDIKCPSFKKKLYHFYRKTRFTAVFYATDALNCKQLKRKQLVLLIWQLFSLNLATFQLPRSNFFFFFQN